MKCSVLVVLALSVASCCAASYNGYCEENGNRYSISSNDCKCFHQLDLSNGNEGYHKCPKDRHGRDLVFNTRKCVCDYAADTVCEGSKTNKCPPPPALVGPVNKQVGDIWCTWNGNNYTIRSRDCKCFRQVDMSNGNNGYFTCPKYTTFNPAVCVCDWAYNSKCLAPKYIKKDDRKCPGCNRADIVFVVDGSGSIHNTEFEGFVKSFLRTVVHSITIGPSQSHIALIQFSDYVKEETPGPLRSDKSSILAGIDSMKQLNGGTNTYKALKRAREILQAGRQDVKQVIFVLTDGEAHMKPQLKDQAQQNHQAGFITYAVGIDVKNNPNAMKELEIIASPPIAHRGYKFVINSFTDLAAMVNKFKC